MSIGDSGSGIGYILALRGFPNYPPSTCRSYPLEFQREQGPVTSPVVLDYFRASIPLRITQLLESVLPIYSTLLKPSVADRSGVLNRGRVSCTISGPELSRILLVRSPECFCKTKYLRGVLRPGFVNG